MKRNKIQLRIDEYERCTLTPLHEPLLPYADNGLDALTAFYEYDTHGRRVACTNPDSVARWIGIKKAIHMHVKEWLAGYREGTLGVAEIEQCISEYRLPDYAAKELRNGIAPRWFRKMIHK